MRGSKSICLNALQERNRKEKALQTGHAYTKPHPSADQTQVIIHSTLAYFRLVFKTKCGKPSEYVECIRQARSQPANSLEELCVAALKCPHPSATVPGCALGPQPRLAQGQRRRSAQRRFILSRFAIITAIMTITLAIYYCYLTYDDNLHYRMRASPYSKQEEQRFVRPGCVRGCTEGGKLCPSWGHPWGLAGALLPPRHREGWDEVPPAASLASFI